MSSEIQDCLFPNLGIFRNMRPSDNLLCSIPRKAYRLRHIDGKTRTFLVMSPYLFKAMRNFDVFNNMSQHKAQFTDFFITNLTFIFMWVLMKEHLKEWREKIVDLLQLIIPEMILFSFFHIFLPTVKYDHHQTYLY